MRSAVMGRFVSFTAGAAVVSLALAGCSAGSGDASASITADSPETATTTALLPLEYETPPQYPDNMEVDSSENAVRFMEFAIETLNYAQRFNDVDAVWDIAVPECDFCSSMTDTLESFQTQSQRRVGGDLTCTYVNGVYQQETGLFLLYTDCETTEATTYYADGTELGVNSSDAFPLTWVVTMVNGPWQLVNVGTTVEGDAP